MHPEHRGTFALTQPCSPFLHAALYRIPSFLALNWAEMPQPWDPDRPLKKKSDTPAFKTFYLPDQWKVLQRVIDSHSCNALFQHAGGFLSNWLHALLVLTSRQHTLRGEKIPQTHIQGFIFLLSPPVLNLQELWIVSPKGLGELLQWQAGFDFLKCKPKWSIGQGREEWGWQLLFCL